jgi:rare lipoprotein A
MTGTIADTASAKSHHHRHHAQRVAKPTPDTTPSILSFFDHAFRATAAPVTTGSGRTFSGVASYYGNEAGNKTASGARFNQNAMTAAHRSLPFGTKLRVTHGDRSVVVTVNDRGPFIKGRVLDLSKGAASAIGLTGRGVGRVVAEVM